MLEREQERLVIFCVCYHHHSRNTSNADVTFMHKAQWCKDFWKPSKPCHVGIHWIALAEYSLMSTICQGFSNFSSFFPHFYSAKLATSSIRVKMELKEVWAMEWN